MVGLSTARSTPTGRRHHREWRSCDDAHECTAPMQVAASLSGMVFGFLEEGEGPPESVSSEEEGCRKIEDLDEDEDQKGKDDNGNVEAGDKTFWENQHQLLQASLCRSNSLETRIRSAIKEALKEIRSANTACACGKPLATSCRKCLMGEVSGRLRNAGYNSAICKSKWRSSPDIPSGEHSFLDVIEKTSSKKGEVRIMIELNFRAEFEMARASEDYNQLVRQLPEVFVGKVERLSSLIKILCSAAKKCMKEKKMHMGPWRKQRYMQAKWLGACERTTSTSLLPMGYSGRLPKPKASMLTVDLLEKPPNAHCTALEVV
ncbi:hypothetical protein FH972_000481 [Carpinus fangiana]|uniref:Uncharacterized protein n=1 Tax=Carpinus fangiana TaxID=176857 RepID=A0A5N6QBW2_9ROSI|nr:hypothetical protein FH972_000481 [Carpinus fangiana]